jgi:hypothetical protein
MATYTVAQVKFTADVVTVVGCALDFYEKYYDHNTYDDFKEQMRAMKMYRTSQHNTYICAWNLWILTNWRETLHTHWQIKPDAKKNEDVRTAYYTLSFTVNNLISEMEKYVDKGIRGCLKQMCYDMFKILKLTNATSSLDFHMSR